MEYNEYDELTSKLAAEIIDGMIEKEAKVVEEDNKKAILPRNQIKGMDTFGTHLRRQIGYGLAGGAVGAGLGAAVSKGNPAGPIMGAAIGSVRWH